MDHASVLGSSGGVEADPGLVSQAGDALGPEHRREGAKHARQVLSRDHRHTVHDDLALGYLGTMDGHDGHHRHAGVGQDLGGLVGLERHRRERRGERVAAMPQPPR
jgi:hypothetical protein